MTSLDEDWTIPAALQPKHQDYAYDLDRALIVGLSSQVPADAFQPISWALSVPAMGY